MKTTLLCIGLGISALLSAPSAFSQNSFTPAEAAGFRIPNFTFGVIPVAGVYYDSTQSGTGLTSDTVRTGESTIFFATYYHYETGGDPTWMNFVGPIVQNSMDGYALSGVPASVSAQFQRATGGQCFDCPYLGLPAVATPVEQRTFNIVDGRWIQMPASGNAATRNMHLARVFTTTAQINTALLETGTVWQCRQRHYWQGVENGSSSGTPKELCGWVRFERRDPSRNWDYVNPVSTTWIQDGQGGHLPSTQPDWLTVPSLNNIATQYQLEAVYTDDNFGAPEGVGSYGNAGRAGFDVELNGQPESNSTGTIVVNPNTGNIHAITHCVGCTSGSSFNRDNAGITKIGQFVWAGVDAEGQERLILRMWSRYLNGWVGEIELTRVPEGLRKQVLPNYVPSANPR